MTDIEALKREIYKKFPKGRSYRLGNYHNAILHGISEAVDYLVANGRLTVAPENRTAEGE